MFGVRPTVVYGVSVCPALCGVGSPVVCVAFVQFVFVSGVVEYLMSYEDAVPCILSSPGAVHASVIDVCVVLDEDRLVVFAGGVVSFCIACFVLNV